jgi:multidrug efflux pump subunit AcrA (membrane-fusion protein)
MKKKKTKKGSARRTVALAAAAGVVLAGGAVWALRTLGAADGEASTGRVLREDLPITVTATGRLDAAVNFEVGPPSSQGFWEYNLTWMIPEGSLVAEGDVVARFDTTQLDDQLREHRVALEKTEQEREKEERNLEVSLRELRLDLVRAQGELKRVDLDLAVPAGLVADIDIEQARLRKRLAEQRVAFLTEKIDFQQRLVQSKLELLDVKREFHQGKVDYNEAIKEKFSVRAPVSGLVVYIPKRNGDRWEVGEGVWMLAKIMKVADVSTLQVEADVLEVDAARVAPGQPVKISVDAVPGMILESEVAEIGEIVHERSIQDPGKVFDAIAPLGEVDTELLRPGMGVQVQIESRLLRDSLTIPVAAVRSVAGETFVDVRRGSGVERRRVELGERGAERVQVLSGLAENEIVVLAEATG